MRRAPDATGTRRTFGSGFLSGLAPLIGSLLLLGLTLLTLDANRAAADPNGFLAEQQALGTVTPVGLGVIAAWYLASSVWLLDRAGRWALARQGGRAVGALLGLVVSALLLALPAVLAVALPQHPAFGM